MDQSLQIELKEYRDISPNKYVPIVTRIKSRRKVDKISDKFNEINSNSLLTSESDPICSSISSTKNNSDNISNTDSSINSINLNNEKIYMGIENNKKRKNVNKSYPNKRKKFQTDSQIKELLIEEIISNNENKIESNYDIDNNLYHSTALKDESNDINIKEFNINQITTLENDIDNSNQSNQPNQTISPSLRKRELDFEVKVHFCETEPIIHEYEPSDIDDDICFLCKENVYANALSIRCDSCQRQFHRECVLVRHGIDLEQRDRRYPYICYICITGSTRASRRTSYDFEPKIFKTILRSILDTAVVPIRQRKRTLGLMDDGLDTKFWPYLESIESRINEFQTLQEFKDSLFEVYENIKNEFGLESKNGKEATRIQKWFEELFASLGAPLDVKLRNLETIP